MRPITRRTWPLGFHTMRRLNQRQGGPIQSIEPSTLVHLWSMLLEPRLREDLLRLPWCVDFSRRDRRIDVLSALRVHLHDRHPWARLETWESPRGWRSAIATPFHLDRLLDDAGWVRAWVVAAQPPITKALTGDGAMALEPIEELLVMDAIALQLWKRIKDSAEVRFQRAALRRCLYLDRHAVSLGRREHGQLDVRDYAWAMAQRARQAHVRTLGPAVFGLLQRLIHAGALRKNATPEVLRQTLRRKGVDDAAIDWLMRRGWRGVRQHFPREARGHEAMLGLVEAIKRARQAEEQGPATGGGTQPPASVRDDLSAKRSSTPSWPRGRR